MKKKVLKICQKKKDNAIRFVINVLWKYLRKKNIFNELAIDNFVPYITEENLLAAQTNIIDVNNYNLCINNNDIEILEVKRGPLCDIQGLQDIPDLGDNRRLRGYDVYNSRLGNLTYDIL